MDLRRLAERGGDQLHDPLGGLESDVADETIADGDVAVAVEEVAAFDVADEVDSGKGAEQRKGVAGEGVALGVFFADGEQADARVGNLEDVLGVDVPHDGELDEVVGVGVDVGADVEQEGRGSA